MITRNRILSAFGADALADLSQDLSEVVLPFGRVIFEVGAPANEIYFPSSGVVSLITLMADGQEVESLTVGREGSVGLLQAMTETTTTERAMVQIAGSAWKVSAARLRDLARNRPAIEDATLRYAQVMVSQLHQASACNAVHDLESRLCRWLLTCEDRVGHEVVPITQELLAMMVGVQRTSVTVAAQALQRRGLIDYGRGRITISDRPGLERASCECYGAAEAIYARIFPNGSANGTDT